MRGTPPTRDEIDAVMLGAQLLVAVTGQSLAAVEADVSLPQLRVMVILASRGPQSQLGARQLEIHPCNRTQNSRRRRRRDTRARGMQSGWTTTPNTARETGYPREGDLER